MSISNRLQKAQHKLTPFRRTSLTVAIAGVLASGFIIGSAYAADSNEATEVKPADDVTAKPAVAKTDENQLSSVVVTANKREESAQKVSTAITVLDGKELIDKGIGKSAGEVLNYVPNASAGTQQHGRPRWWIRGVGAGQQQFDLASPVGIYLDEVYISNASATGFPLFDLQSVQVLRGPQGTLWGKNTTGGAVAITSKKPSFNDSKTDDYVKVDYGSFNDRSVQGGVGGTIVDERLAGRISFYQQDQDGRLNNQFTGGKDGGLSDGAIRGQLLAILTPNLEALLNVHYRKYETDGAITTTQSYAANGVFRNGYIPSTRYKDVSTNAVNNSDSSQNGVSLNLKWQLGKLALTSITAYEDYETESLGDGDNTPLEISRSHSKGKSRQVSQEFRLASPREDQWNWLTGLHLFREEIDVASQSGQLPVGSVPGMAGATNSAAPGANFNTSDLNHKTTSFAVFGSTTYNFTEQLATTLGLRWSREKKEYDLNRRGSVGATSAARFSSLGQWWNSYTGPFAAAGPIGSGTFSTNDSKTWDAFTFDITPEYKITDHDRVYFKFAHGIKSGGFNTAATSLAAVNQVDPETLNASEVGYKSEWLNGRLNFNASAFHYSYEDVQVNVVGFNALANSTVSYLQNAKKAHVNGLEFEVEALPIENLHVNASLGLLKSEYDDAEIQNNGGSFSGNELVRSPHVNAILAGDYRIPVANGAKVVIGGDARYTSKQYYYVTPQTSDRDILNQDAYTIVNARIAYSTAGEKYTWTAYVNNLFDKEYNNHALPAFNVAGGVNGDSVYRGLPRTVGVSFITRF